MSLSKNVFISALGAKPRSIPKINIADIPETNILSFMVHSILDEIMTNKNRYL
ncbi:hypothetical protein SDC9_69229 [bioreactor metagenome]|uniref:Uncharacterized protein n=1 Tax=bioreactor metagenome TaxID=1076179 RepID=A0A644Y4C8_9ZZZZ